MYTVDIVNLNKVIPELNINSGCHVRHYFRRGCRDRDRMVVEITTTYAICAYHHWYCEFEYCSGRGVQHYV